MKAVITTISNPTNCVKKLVEKISQINGELIVVGDKKGPSSFELEHTSFFSIEDQGELPFKLALKIPENHYSRKNLGYLYAILKNADCIYETDDDNAPLAHWKIRKKFVEDVNIIDVNLHEKDCHWVNIYRYFTEELIWPRGLPLSQINISAPPLQKSDDKRYAPIQQSLVNNSPDVDAIWRLILNRSFMFNNTKSVFVGPGLWCPFNTQSTWWWPEVYPLLYIPSFCSFRMCDIWKSFIAQRCLWEIDAGVVFHAPEVYQDRNYHNLEKDFEDELPGYTKNMKFAQILSSLSLKPGMENVLPNLIACYEILIENGFFPKEEMKLVISWAHDIEKILKLRNECK